MRRLGIASRVDDSSASIGKKYARNDELGTPFGCTVDFACELNALDLLSRERYGEGADDSALSKGTMTLRERDSTSQLIGPIDTVVSVVDELVKGTLDWEGASSKLDSYSGVQDVE